MADKLDGWLNKKKSNGKGLSMFSSDNRRWFRIREVEGVDNHELLLSYFKTPKETEPRGWIYLKDVTEIFDDGKCFTIISAARTMTLEAPTSSEHIYWLEGLIKLCPRADISRVVSNIKLPKAEAKQSTSNSGGRRSGANSPYTASSSPRYDADAKHLDGENYFQEGRRSQMKRDDYRGSSDDGSHSGRSGRRGEAASPDHRLSEGGYRTGANLTTERIHNDIRSTGDGIASKKKKPGSTQGSGSVQTRQTRCSTCGNLDVGYNYCTNCNEECENCLPIPHSGDTGARKGNRNDDDGDIETAVLKEDFVKKNRVELGRRSGAHDDQDMSGSRVRTYSTPEETGDVKKKASPKMQPRAPPSGAPPRSAADVSDSDDEGEAKPKDKPRRSKIDDLISSRDSKLSHESDAKGSTRNSPRYKQGGGLSSDEDEDFDLKSERENRLGKNTLSLATGHTAAAPPKQSFDSPAESSRPPRAPPTGAKPSAYSQSAIAQAQSIISKNKSSVQHGPGADQNFVNEDWDDMDSSLEMDRLSLRLSPMSENNADPKPGTAGKNAGVKQDENWLEANFDDD